MKQELKRVDPLSAANVGALVYGLVMCAFALIFFPFFLLAGLLAPSGGSGLGGPLMALGMLVLYPIMGVVMGWISGLLTCAVYNLVVRWCGGLLLEFENVSPGSSSEAA